jgi:hypothetical protein
MRLWHREKDNGLAGIYPSGRFSLFSGKICKPLAQKCKSIRFLVVGFRLQLSFCDYLFFFVFERSSINGRLIDNEKLPFLLRKRAFLV